MGTQKVIDLKWKLLNEFGTTEGVPFCKEAFAFIVDGLPIVKIDDNELSEAIRKQLADGTLRIDRNSAVQADRFQINSPLLQVSFKDDVYIIYEDGTIKAFNPDLPKQGAKNVAFKFGPVSLILCPYNITDATMKCDDRDYDETAADYVTKYSVAVAQYNGQQRTEWLVTHGLKIADKTPDNYFIPSLGELYVMYAMKERINQALDWIGQELLLDYWYWSSTELSASGAWLLHFSDGGFNDGGKTGTHRVRPVSAFVIPSTL